jgi:DNA mismatch repair protein MutL
MGRIRVLSDNVANKIAAGEVVERPASVVKEMMENSLDAGATSIRVEVENAGRRLIRIVDNGSGMLRDDALLAFERHATSKLSDVKDLLSIATLGFRGEALPSIASVSRLVLETRSSEEQTGMRVEIAGGKILNCEEIAQPQGTTISVRDLFFNVPARKKFLRSEQTELAHIASLVTHYSLAHPSKAFELRDGARDLLNVEPVTTLRERVFQVFGSDMLDDLIELAPHERLFEVDPEEPPLEFALHGFVSRPQVQKNNRNSIFIFVNGRLIRDKVILHALSAAYYNLMPPACFPFALLFLDCDPQAVDVNVHPSKTEVRFRQSSFVHDFVRDSIREQLMESRPAPSFRVSPSPQPGAQLPYSEFTQMIENAPVSMVEPAEPQPILSEPRGDEPLFALRPQPGPAPRLDFYDAPPSSSSTPAAAAPASPTLRLRIPDTHGGFPTGVVTEGPPSLAGLADLRPLGQLHESFILAAGRDGLWIIDQHVAHERILFENVLTARASGRVEVQQLLMPLVITLTPGQQIEFARIADELAANGFEAEPFGNRTIAVKAAPASVGPADLERVIFEILEIAEAEARRVSLDDLRRAIAASIACRAAIKINTRLDQAKMEYLLRELAKCEFPMACPHGRPVALQYSTKEILKAFHRI